MLNAAFKMEQKRCVIKGTPNYGHTAMRILQIALCSAAAAIALGTIANAQFLQPQSRVNLRGDVAYPEELSGLAFWRDRLVACPDEGAELNVFQPAGDDYELLRKVSLLDDASEEIDMEAVASDGEYLYIAGSHSMRRKKVEEDSTYEKNRKRLARVTPHDASYSLFRVRLDDAGGIASSESITLWDVLDADEILNLYTYVPSKENGIDIEGLAVKDGRLYVGFRGPVLRGNFVPVISFEFDRSDDYELAFVQLGGRGVRDLLAVDDGLLILAGPIGDGDASYKLYDWNGEDCVPGEGGPGGVIVELGELAVSGAVKPEGLSLLEETADQWKLLLASDGDASASTWLVPKP
jgi:hypothetical protein